MIWDMLMSPAWMRPLGWALAHSTWQITEIALLYRSAAELWGRTASRRHALSCVALLASIALFVGTFVIAYQPQASVAPTRPDARPPAVTALVATSPDRSVDLAAYLEPWTELAALIWLAMLVISAVRFAGALADTGRLYDTAIGPAPIALADYVATLRTQMGVRRPIRLRCSAAVDCPTLIGWLRPLILIPPQATGLQAHRIAPLLAHEVAHVRRHDYAINLVQAVIDRLFFYHPALRWLSGQVRVAREHCCDDSAVIATDGGPIAYARSLAGIEALRAHPARLAASDTGLVHRLRRLLAPARPPRRLIALATLTLAGLLAASGTQAMVPSVSATTVLDGLDPVHLLGGQQLQGAPSRALRLHGYRYLFADDYTRERFLANPERYAVRNVHACPITGDPVRPDVWHVVDGRIVLFCCPRVLAALSP